MLSTILLINMCRYVATITPVTIGHLRELNKWYSVYKRPIERECIARWIYRFAVILKVDPNEYMGDYVSSSSSSSDDDDEDEQPTASAESIYVDLTEPLVQEPDAEDEYITEDQDMLYED